MNVHKNARLTPIGRERIVRLVASGQTPKAVAQAAGVCPRTIRKWVDRYHREGPTGLNDRSSRPHRLYRPTPQALVEQVEALRRARHTGKQIAADLHLSPATVSRILRRLGLNRIAALEPCEPARRYEREHPGEMIHIDIKKLGRIDGIGHRITGDRRGQCTTMAGTRWFTAIAPLREQPFATPSHRSRQLRARKCVRVSRPRPRRPGRARPSNQDFARTERGGG
jgi:transposase-like protein